MDDQPNSSVRLHASMGGNDSIETEEDKEDQGEEAVLPSSDAPMNAKTTEEKDPTCGDIVTLDHKNDMPLDAKDDTEAMPIKKKATSATFNTTESSLPDTTTTTAATTTQTSPRKAQFHAFLRSLLEVDQTQIALIPGMRTAIIIMTDWIIFGIGNANTTAFQLGCLYVGLTDANGSLTNRLHSMGLTLITVVVMGALIPSLTYTSIPGTLIAAFGVAFLTGCAPIFGNAAFILSMKLGAALFAIQGSVHRNTDGYGGISNALLWTFFGGSCSLLAALLPELVGNRDAIRTSLFKVWHGFGSNLAQWKAQWGTFGHTGHAARLPNVTLSFSSTLDFIQQDTTEDPNAKAWLLQIMEHVDAIRTASLCLSNGYEMVRQERQQKQQLALELSPATHDDNNTPASQKTTTTSQSEQQQQWEEEDSLVDTYFHILARVIQDLGLAFQFPWSVRYVPCIRKRVISRKEELDRAAAAFSNHRAGSEGASSSLAKKWVHPLLTFLQAQVDASVQIALDTNKQWPPHSSVFTLPKRICAVFQLPKLVDDKDWAIRGYAIRFAVAFTLATLPEVLAPRGTSGHWFPMTVALIMGPTQGATYEKVAHRTLGTLCGIGLGAAISPLFAHPQALILLLGLNTYAVCIFLPANYAMFTFFVTSWVFCTTVGVGASMGVTIFYRCMWTLSAAALVLAVSYTYPAKTEFQLTEKLAAFAQAILVFAQAVVEEHRLLELARNGTDDSLPALLEQATQKAQEAKKVATQTRLDLLTDVHNAVLCPSEGYRIDPHSVAPRLASDLVDAIVIPLFLFLVKDDNCDSLVSDLNDFQELERLVQRLEAHAALPPGKPTRAGQRHESSTLITGGEGPFSKAVATAHQRLDEAGVPKRPTLPAPKSDV
ncbi:expressed unknown protein [Seminavis robusta]|uniref:Integral membrane bound transporter domain-containing protein n=1 Tax=Seminavis robusta TaxID=568900 RepID=A0A9N8EK48_9STRA|nr:expressed unknown protein [Seminavis robusta]|eukprot:Sro1339_g264270.1 n/a (885) ;mRNA; f:1594-4248